jgi:hypothetical protein
LLCRLERIERNQAELNHMVLQMKAEQPEKACLPTANGLALGSPIESVEPPPRAQRARPDMSLPPFARSLPILPLLVDPTSRAIPDVEPPGSPGDEEVPVQKSSAASAEPTPASEPSSMTLPDPTSRAIPDVEPPGSPGDEEVPVQKSSAASAEPTPASEPSLIAVPLPEEFKLKARRRWFFSRRYQFDSVAPDFLWVPSRTTGDGPAAPPAPPGFFSTEVTIPSTVPTEPEFEASDEEASEPGSTAVVQ